MMPASEEYYSFGREMQVKKETAWGDSLVIAPPGAEL
jgi:hypothetical protein